MIQASLNRGSRLGAKTSVQGKPWSSLGPEIFPSVFQKQGGNFNFEKNVEFLEFFGFTLRFRTF